MAEDLEDPAGQARAGAADKESRQEEEVWGEREWILRLGLLHCRQLQGQHAQVLHERPAAVGPTRLWQNKQRLRHRQTSRLQSVRGECGQLAAQEPNHPGARRRAQFASRGQRSVRSVFGRKAAAAECPGQYVEEEEWRGGCQGSGQIQVGQVCNKTVSLTELFLNKRNES